MAHFFFTKTVFLTLAPEQRILFQLNCQTDLIDNVNKFGVMLPCSAEKCTLVGLN